MNENPSVDTTLPSLVSLPGRLVAQLGPHAATALGLDLAADDDADLARWLVASVLLGGRTPETVALDAFRRLDADGLSLPIRLVGAGFPELHRRLEEAGVPKSEAVAAVLTRVCGTLVEGYAGSVDRLVAGADGLEDLAGRLSRLGSGFGKAGVLRFLTPLRERWSALGDLPTSPAVLAAGQDLGWIPQAQDEEGAPASLARNASAGSGVPLRDIEAALEKLGRSACLRGRVDRCPLAGACPRGTNAET